MIKKYDSDKQRETVAYVLKKHEKALKSLAQEDYSKPSAEINYETKKRGKRRRGEEVETPKRVGRLEPYKREKIAGMVEHEIQVSVVENEDYCPVCQRWVEMPIDCAICDECDMARGWEQYE